MAIIHSNLVWKNHNGLKKLFLNPTDGEKSTTSNLLQLNPYTSKLAAALFNGLEIFPIRSNSNIFLIDEYSNTVLEHVSKIITDGKISHSKNSDDFNKNHEKIDIIYLDLNQNKNILETLKNYEQILKQNGFLIFLYNFQQNENQNIREELQNTLNKLKETFELLQEINLSDFFKSTFMIIMTKR